MNVFVSGPLMFRDVLHAVTGCLYPAHCALLHGYAQFMIKDEPMPAVMPFPDRVVDGVVYRDVEESAARAIRKFYGVRFAAEEVTVEAENGEWVEAVTYLITPGRRKLLTAREWDEDDFREHHMQKVVSTWRT